VPHVQMIDAALRLVLVRAWGTVSDEELAEHARALRADPRFRPDFRQLGDLRGITTLDATRAGIRQLAELSPFGAGARRAIVVGSEVAFGMARMYELMRGEGQDEVEVFRDLPAALDWLGIAGAQASPLLARLGEAERELGGTGR